MKPSLPKARMPAGSLGFALQILLMLLLLVVHGTTQAAASCPTGMTLSTDAGNAASVILDTGVDYETQATGAPSATNTTPSSSNSALVAAGDTLGLDLDKIIPEGSTIEISLGRNNSSGRVRIEMSLDDNTYTSVGTFGASGTLGTGTTSKLGRINVTIPTGSARYIRFIREAGGVWIDAVSYTEICTVSTPYDYGDAPDTANGTSSSNYETLKTDNGPRHIITPGLNLGATVDADNGTLQNLAANADDTSGTTDDEDGLIAPPIIPTTSGQPYTLTSYVNNTIGSAAYLSVYIDFNRDGDFLDAGEKASTQTLYGSNYVNSVFTTPTGLTPGVVYARLRLSFDEAAANSPVGAASSGEVEDYALTVSSAPYYDFGDAPTSYGSAQHTINSNIYLGSIGPDAEAANQPTYNASGDGIDEDGAPRQTQNLAITLFPILKVNTSSYSVDVRATNTTGTSGKLYGWIDFDQNGVFDLDEAASVSAPNNTSGTNLTLTWNSIPTDIKVGTTFIRLRLTTDTSVTLSKPTGNASNGEVEDYPIAVALDIPPNSPTVTIIKGDTSASCASTLFTDNFDDLPNDKYFGEYTSATPYVIRNWTATGGGVDTYARTLSVGAYAATQGISIYFGNGTVRRVSPEVGTGFTFDGNGKLTSALDAIELRDDADDTTPGYHSHEADWGPNPVKFSRTFTTVAGNKYRLYFSAIPEDAGNPTYASGIMRVDTPSGSIHFKAPGGQEGLQKYRIEFTATSTSSTISFINYGHISTDGGWCDPSSLISGAWCTANGHSVSKTANELIIDDVVIAAASACATSNISGFVYIDRNLNDSFNTATDGVLNNISVTLYDNNNTPATTDDDTVIATTSTASNGAYSFTDVSPSMHYRIEVDTHDTDLPTNAYSGTSNPLMDVTVASGSNLTNQNFGFDMTCEATAGQFGGLAFRDYNQNGIHESNEDGIAGVTVTAYDASNTAIANATTDVHGWYKLSGLTNGTQYRLEYTGLAVDLSSSAHGTDTATNVRFVTAAASCSNHYGVNDPVEYCQANPSVATYSYTQGDPAATNVGSYTSIHTFPYDASGTSYSQTIAAATKASIAQTGALWGMAYQKSSKTLFASAAIRRFAGLGSLGTGGIYKVDMSNPTANTGASPYIDIRNIGIPTGADIVRGTDACNTLANNPWGSAHDVAAWDAVGKIGIGDIDYDEANNKLWLVNLNDRKLYGIKNVTPSSTPTAADVLGGYSINLPSPYTCTSGTFRPWAVKYYRGNVYVGGVCDAASDPYTQSKVRGYVLKFNPANTAAGFSYVKDFALDQTRPDYSGYEATTQWNGWIPPADAIGWPYFHSPIIGNIEFDTDGSIIIGVIDRAGLQNGNNSYDEPSCTDTSLDYTTSRGDILRLCKTDTGYLSDSELGCSTNIPVNSKIQNEYYWGDMGPTYNSWESMNEISAGGLAMIPGSSQVLTNAFDAGEWGSNSVVWLNNTTGGADKSYYVTWTTTNKSAGMGELEVMCDQSPIEVGNRVWLDTDKDGIQDAGEAGINNVTVTLTCGTDTATTTTNAEGEYYFSNTTGGNTTFMDSGESCKLKINTSQANLSGYSLTTQNADSKTDNNSATDIRDSDAANNAGTAEISFTVGSNGQNNHGLDFGFTSLSGTSLSGKVFEDVNYGGGLGRSISSTGIAVIMGVRVELYDSTGAFITSSNTIDGGPYTFSNVANGNYYVRVVNDTIRSSRAGSNATERAIQTYRTDGTTAVNNEVGGRNPALVDSAANTTNQTLNTTTFKLSGGGQAQSVQPITVTGSAITGANFGFNFSTIVNTNDSGQGSLRQFLLNANLLSRTGISQVLPASIQADYSADTEVSIFMIPTSALSGGVATITLSNTNKLPALNRADVALDARTQTLNIGDTNPGTLGTAQTVGIDGLNVLPISRPEVAIDVSAITGSGAVYPLTINALRNHVRGFSLYGAITGGFSNPSAAVFVSDTGSATIKDNVFGALPDGSQPATAKQNRRFGFLSEGVSQVSGNYFAYNGYGAVFSLTNAKGSSFTANYMENNGPNANIGSLTGAPDGDAVAVLDLAEVLIEGNYIRNSTNMNGVQTDLGKSVELSKATNTIIRNNTLLNGYSAGIGAFNGTTNSTIEKNIITTTRGSGTSPTGPAILVSSAYAVSSGITISHNHTFANSGLGIDLDARTTVATSTGNGITINDASDADTGPNSLLNFPILSQIAPVGGNLTIKGCAPAGSTVELFEADVSTGGAATTGANKFGKTQDYGEGQTYLTRFVEGSGSDTDTATCTLPIDTDGNNQTSMNAFSISIPLPTGITSGDMLTSTATLASTGTSEFSPALVVSATSSISGTVYTDGNGNNTYDSSTEFGISSITVNLLNDANGANVATTSTAADGSYSFSNINAALTYRVAVDTADTDLPTGSTIRTTNPLTGITVTASVATANKNFGFNPPPTVIKTPPAYAVCKTTSVEQLDAFQYATATGSGATGTPSLTYQAPTGSNRMMLAILSVERDHTPTTPRGDNFETSNPGVVMPTLTFGGVSMQNNAFSAESAGSSNNFADAEVSRSYYFYTLFDLSIPAGAQKLEVSGINIPNNAGDEAILTVATFANVGAANPIDTPDSAIDRIAPFNISLSASPTTTNQPPGTTNSDNMLLAFGSSSRAETLTIGTGWNKLAEIQAINGNGIYNTSSSGRTSGPYTENDGHTLLIQSIKGVSTTQTALMSSTANNIVGLGMHVFRLTAHGCDYGDAPASYGDAYHSQSWSRRIGTQRGDAETATLIGTNANGDDSNGLDDEDGVTMPALTAGQSSTISVSVGGSAYLSAWIDWNGDGDFADSGEKIANDLQDSDADGIIQITTNVPANATTSQTYARLRQSINTGADATGWASYGEVEDYALTITAPACSLVVTTTADIDNAANGSGSLRDAIECANSKPGTDTITFNMPNTEAGFTNPTGAGNDYWSLVLNSQLPSITEAVTIDGTTQTTNKGNTNAGNVASASTVGSNAIAIAAVAAPEVEIVGQWYGAGFDIKANNVNLYGLGLRKFDTDIRLDKANTSGILMSGMAFGVNPVSGTDPGAGQRSNQHIAVNASNVSFVLTNSILGYNDTKRGIVTGENNSVSNITANISGNHFVGVGLSGNSNNAAIEILRTQNPSVMIAGNRFVGRGKGTASDLAVEFNDYGGGDVTCTTCLVENNDMSGFHDGVGYFTDASMTGLIISKNRIFDNTEFAVFLGNVQNASVSQNQLYNNGKSGVLINKNAAKGNTITQNSIYNNGEVGINLAGGNQVDPGGITLNDANDTDSGPNNLLNFPILNQVIIGTTNITVRGCAQAGAVVEVFEADVSTGGAATSGANSFGLSRDYGEGQRYLASLAENSAADSDSGDCSLPSFDGNDNTGMKAFQFTIALPAGLTVNDKLTATATLTGVGTSEFGPMLTTEGAPPSVGGGSCAATGGTDILFIVDNSGSITTSEYTDFANTIQSVGSKLLTTNPANRIAVAHFGGPSDSLTSGGQYVYFERNFSSTTMNTPIRQFGENGAYDANWWADHLAGALQQIRYGLDGNTGTSSNYIVSPIKELSRNLTSPLQIVLMTDAVRYGDYVPNDITMLIDPAGSGAEPDDGSNFTVYNELKAQGINFSVVSFNPDPTDIATSAAIASVGGTYTGSIEANPKDPAGSQTTPRRFVSVTSGFQLTTAQIDELVEGTAICSSNISGLIFEDIHYGGGAARPASASGTVSVAGATIEVYGNTGNYIASVSSNASGNYQLPSLPDNTYYVRVVSDSVNSSRTGHNGSEVPVMTYPSVGGKKPAAADAGTNSDASSLNTSTLVFNSGALNGKQAQAVRQVTLTGSNMTGMDFGFNFSTIVNTNDSGQGSLRQFLLNANLLGDDSTLMQTNIVAGKETRLAGKENAILELPTSDPKYDAVKNYWSIALNSPLPTITSPLVLDGSLPAGSNSTPTLELKGTTAGAGSNGLTLTVAGNTIRKLAINGFGGAGIYLNASNDNNLQANYLGMTPDKVPRANTGAGIRLNNANNNLIGGTANDMGNVIANNGGDGITVTGASLLTNAILSNSIHSNGGLGIDINDDNVTPNNASDNALNYPEVKVNSFGANGTKVVTYDFNLDVPAGNYRLEFFTSTAKDPSGNGEGEIFIGSKDITHPGTGSLNIKGTFNATMTVNKGTFIATTLTQKISTTSFSATSEFSGISDGITTQLCESLIDSSSSGSNIVIDENIADATIKLLEAYDYSTTPATPITYVISGGADGGLFTVENPTAGATLPCASIKFIKRQTVITKAASADIETRAIITPAQLPSLGNYEQPLDNGNDNVYDFQVTGTTSTGKKYVRDLSVQIMDSNEAPFITSAAGISFMEDTNADVSTIKAQDPDDGDTLSFNISGGVDAKQFEITTTTGILRFRAIPDYDAPTDTNRDNSYEVEVSITDTSGLSASKLFNITVTNNTDDDGVLLNVRALLQGAYNTKTGLMSDDLNKLGILPTQQPYGIAPFNHTGAETLSTLLREATDSNAVVDWVLVELRSSPSSVIASRAVMLQRDGNLVDSQTGSATLHFASVKAGNYYVSVRHRNHLGIISVSPVSLDHTERLINFTSSSTAIKGEESCLISGKLALMWAGDINANNTLTANGPNNDLTNLMSNVISDKDNAQGNTNHILHGYLATDLNMDGKTLFTGPNNDTSLLVGNIILHPLNTGFAANYIVRGGL